MKLVLIVGAGAVGKMTVGQELMKITNLRLFHNHMMIEPVLEIFGKFKGDTILKLREVIFDDFVNDDNEGMIHTLMWAFDMKSDWEYVENLVSKFDEVYCVELIASQEVRLERNKTENRLINKASKRDIEASNGRLLNEDRHRLAQIIISDQKKSLDIWIDYLFSDEINYPLWAKYWAFHGMLSLGSYSKSKKGFTRRNKSTLKIFPVLDEDALYNSIKFMTEF
jgi:hypothetical protein